MKERNTFWIIMLGVWTITSIGSWFLWSSGSNGLGMLGLFLFVSVSIAVVAAWNREFYDMLTGLLAAIIVVGFIIYSISVGGIY